MTDVTMQTTRAVGAGHRFATVMEAIRAAVQRIRREARINRDRRYLENAPDAVLRDIGIDRWEIDSITRFGAREPRA